jgi:tetratricopeptide (TPR) repeat protein
VALANLGGLRLLQGKPSEAENLYLEAERVLLAGHGPNHPELVPVFNGLANVHSETGRYADARRNSERALALMETVEDDPQLGIALFLLAKVEWKQKREAVAEPLLRRAIEVWRRSLGPQHPTYASGLTSLALLLSGKDPGESERLFRDALAVIESTLGPGHAFTGQILVLYASHLGSLGRKGEAKELRQRGKSIVARQSRENRLGHTIDIRNLR